MSISSAQERRRIEIDTAGFLDRDEVKFPGATILTRDDMNQVKISHEGVILWCDQAIHYTNDDFIEAYGNVRVKQGDTVEMTSKYVEYSGKTKLAFASGDVILTEPSSTLTTDTLYFDRVKQQAYYTSKGKVVRDTSGTITSQIGRYYMSNQKYQFVQDVKLVNEEYTIDSNQLDFYTETGHAYLFGPTTITSESSVIYCERGFYNTNDDTGYFVKKSRIDYDNRIFEGDSMYFDRNQNFASATNNIKVTDTTNKLIVKGHYAEVFREKDSVFITKRALAITVKDQDSMYVHGDTLMVTGDSENRITRAYYKVKIFKSDLSGKADSIHTNHKKGLTQLINLDRFSSTDAFTVKRKPILWNVGNQMTGDSIHLITNTETEKLDSLKVFNDAFVISRDTLGDGFNQIKGQKLYGQFKDNELYLIDIINNAESIYYLRNDENELVGIDKSKSGNMKIWVTENTIDEVRKIRQIDGSTYPESQFPDRERILNGFDWRDDERPKSVEDLFVDDPPLSLPIIKGLEDYVPQEEFFDDKMIDRVNKSDQSKKGTKNKAARNIPKPLLDQKKPTGKLKAKKDQN
ncbi:MAG: hypothetical protein HKN54_07560 [Flavobacteriaceae bacterium]|nr:hypothetical protein [Flavobacteriaceae bacterium]